MKLKSQCLRHRWYKDQNEAEKAMSNAIHKYKINLTRAYKCNYCGGWHLTSK